MFFAKKRNRGQTDTATNTEIQRALLIKGVSIKKEYIKVEDVRSLQFQILVITDLKTGAKIKGLYLDNQAETGWGGKNGGIRSAYLDEIELDQLLEFLDNCDKKWKKEKVVTHTEYVYTTNDNLRISFWTLDSNDWRYSIKFTNYYIDNVIELTKKRSEDLLDALKKIKDQMAKY